MSTACGAATAHRDVVEVVELARTEVSVSKVRAVSTVVRDGVAVVDLPSEAAVEVEEDVSTGGHRCLGCSVHDKLTAVEEPSATTVVLVLVVGALTDLETVVSVQRLVLQIELENRQSVPVPLMVPPSMM